MYLQNKYTKCYYSIIDKSLSREELIIFESHHIVPKSLGGTNQKENLAKLTPREHFICHLLLMKMTEGLEKRKMSFAIKMMIAKSSKHARDFKITSKMYEIIKTANATAMKELWADPEMKLKASIRSKNLWKNDQFRERLISLMTERNNNSDYLNRLSLSQKKRWADPAERKKQSEKQLLVAKENPEIGKKKARPGNLNGMYGKTHSDQVKLEQSQRSKDLFKDKTYEEIHGVEKAIQLKKQRSESMRSIRKLRPGNGADNSNSKKYHLIDPNGIEYFVAGNIVVFCKEHKISYAGLINVIKKRRETYKGWTGRYADQSHK
jgi:hypothetical protein